MKKEITKNYSKIGILSFKYIYVLLFGLTSIAIYSQVANYTVDQLAFPASYTTFPLAAGTPVGSPAKTNIATGTPSNIDDQVTNINFGGAFNFNYNGTTYTSVNVSVNGFVYFGTASGTPSTEYNPISSTNSYSGAISVYGRDLDVISAANSVGYRVIGSAPNRVYQIEWVVRRSNGVGGTDTNNMIFQLWMYENNPGGADSNKIEMIYNTFTPNNATTLTGQIGLRGSSNSDFKNLSYTTATAPWPTLPTIMAVSTTVNTNSVVTKGTSATASASISTTAPNNSNRLFRWTPVTCFAPSGLNVTALTSSSATINWSAASPAPTDGYEYYVGTSPTPSVSGNVGAGVLSASISSLLPNTTYYYAVRSVCTTGTNISSWSSVSSFTTYCSPVNLNYYLSFDGAGTPLFDDNVTVPGTTPFHGPLPACTQQQNVGAGNNWVTSNEAYYPGLQMDFQNNFLMYNGSNPGNSNPANTWFYTKGVNLTAGQSYQLSYLYSGTDTPSTVLNKMKIGLGTSPVSTSMTTILQDHTDIKGGPFLNIVNFTAPTTGVYYVGFNCYSGANNGQLALDDIQIVPSVCLRPTAVSVANITGTSALLSWTAPTPAPSNGYVYYYSTSSTAPTNATTPSGSVGPGVTSVTLTGLTGGPTTYYFWVRTSCGGGDFGEWVALNNAGNPYFTTLYQPVYCTPSSTINTTYINNLTTTNGVANISNSSGYTTGGYANYTSQFVSQSAGNTINYSLGFIATGGVGVGIWVDWTNDGDFLDAGENVYSSGAFLSSSPLTGTITVPAGQALGDYRMRIVTDWFSTSPSSCTISPTGPRGEAEDYTFKVVTPPPPLTLNVTSDTQCAGTNSVLVQITQPTPLSTYDSYSWSPSIGVSGSAATGYIFNNTITTVYTLTATQSSAPYATNTVKFTYNANPLPTPIVINPTSPSSCQSGPAVQLISSGGLVNGFPILTENFNTGAPGWTTVNNSTGGTPANADWTIRNSGYNPAGASGITNVTSNDSSQFYISNSDSQGSGSTTNVELISPVFGIASTYTSVSLSFYHYLKLFLATNNPYGKVLLSTDGGATYPITLKTYDYSSITNGGNVLPMGATPTAFGFENTIDLTAYAGQSNLRIKFQYYDKWGFVWAIDNFLVSGTASSAVNWNTQTAPVANGIAVPGLYTNAAATTAYIAGTGAASVYAMPSATTTYTASASTPAPVCSTITTTTVTVTPIVAGTASGTQTICYGTPADLTLTGYSGTITKWQYATDFAFTTPVDIPSSNSATLTGAQMGSLTATRYYRAVVTNGSCTTYSNVLTVTVDSTTYSAGAWSNGTPTSSTMAIFNGNYTSTGNLSACSVVVNSGNVVFQSGHTLSVQNSVSVVGGSLTFDNNASLVQINNVANSGNITYTRSTTPVLRLDYTYWSTPVSPQVLSTFSPLSPANRFFVYDPTIDNWSAVSASSTMQVGKGYIFRSPSNFSDVTPAIFTGSFIGVPNNGQYSTPITLSTGNFNLIGNPYPSAINADLFMSDALNSSTINATIYLWTHNTPITANQYSTNDYAIYNYLGGVGTMAAPNTGINNSVPTGKIAAGQGFFVKATATGSVTFKNSMRVVGNNSQFYKMNSELEKHRFWLEILNDNGAYKQTLIGYAETATNNLDNGFDSTTLDAGNPIMLYSLLNQDKLAIQGRALPFNDHDVIPLGYKSTVATNYQIRLSDFDGLFNNQDIYLVDKLLNLWHNLKQADYPFVSDIGTFNDRFEIHFIPQALNTLNVGFTDSDVIVYKDYSQSIIATSQNTTIDKIEIFDVRGRKLFGKDKINSNQYIISNLQLANQVLIVKVATPQGTVTKKINY